MENGKLSLAFGILAALGIVLAIRIFSLQVVNHEVYEVKARNRAFVSKNIHADRGKIMDRHGVVLADAVSDEKGGSSRIFPNGQLASQILGKVGHGGKGSMGLERIFDEQLRGRIGYRNAVRDNRSREVAGLGEVMVESLPGKNLVLTIDASMQEIVEDALKTGVAEFAAMSASAVVIDPYTGDILAAATYPTFDPNSKMGGVGAASKCDIFSLAYEPGSTFKVVTAMAALEENVVTPDEVFDGEGGAWKLPHKVVIREHNGKDLGNMNMAEALAKSSNIVYAKIADRVGDENFYRFVRNFGFGTKTSSELPGEEAGMLKKPYDWSARSLKTLGFGHELLVTPIQMAMAFSAVANGGILMAPRIVLEWQDSTGRTVEKTEPDSVRRMVSESTAATLREMLQGVVSSGTATRVNSKALPEIEFSGKTGTAEKYSKELGRYDRHSQIASFIGLAPAMNPKYVCLVLVDDPKTRTAGGTTAGPIFRRIMEGIYFNPKLSPMTFRLAAETGKANCDRDWNGLTLDEATSFASANECKLAVNGTGDVIVSSVRLAEDSVEVKLGEDRILQMPDLNGLSLKDALAQLGKARLSVEFSGSGRVVEQSPLPNEKLERGQVCRLVLKERV